MIQSTKQHSWDFYTYKYIYLHKVGHPLEEHCSLFDAKHRLVWLNVIDLSPNT